jgi:uncharacterized protein YciI
MKRIVLIILIYVASASVYAQDKNAEAFREEMKTYTMVFMKKGPAESKSEKEAAKIQQEHLSYLAGMKEMGILIMSGPLTDDNDVESVLIFYSEDEGMIQQSVINDPAVLAGRLVPEFHKWYTQSGIKLP